MSRSVIKKVKFACVAAVSAGMITAPASAVVTWYSSSSSLLAAAPLSTDPTGMSAVTTDAQAIALMSTSPSAWRNTTAQDQLDITLGLVTISAAPELNQNSHGFFMNIDGGDAGSSVGFAGASYRIGNAVNENHSYTIAGLGATAFGLSIFEPRGLAQCGGVSCSVSRFTFEAFDAMGASLGANNLDFGQNAETAFFGLTSTTAFTRLTVTETFLSGVHQANCCAYDNEYFGNYLMTAANAASPTPEPASWAMMLGGFGMIGGALRRRQRAGVRA